MPATESRPIVLDFGKYNGTPLDEVPGDYLRWCLDKLERLSPSLRTAIEVELIFRVRDPHRQEKPSPPLRLPAGVDRDAAFEIVQAGRQQLARRHHPDAGGDEETMKTINQTCDFLLQRLFPRVFEEAA